jgi:outer membrane immunogenic protein
MMRARICIATIAALIGMPAFAADMAVKAPPPAPTVLPVYNWTGWYVGLNAGYSWGHTSNDWNFFAPNNFIPASPCPPAISPAFAFCATGSDSNKLNGAIGGVQAGYNWQTGNFLFGAETDIQYSGQKGDALFVASAPVPGFPPAQISASYTEKLLWFGTLRARIGFTPSQQWLIFLTGGLAYGEVSSNGSATSTGAGGPAIQPLGNWSNSATKTGWTVGGGVEVALPNNWSLKFEYIHIDLGELDTTIATFPGCFGTIAKCIPAAAGTGTVKSRITDEVARIGINYRFGGPIVTEH